ncbi:MAG: ABC transporter ATP-binding protein [Alphaproteobacteria bacterium]|nr:ABC transporter ATP-binding protein [Alphaproteobacteria bacterium]
MTRLSIEALVKRFDQVAAVGGIDLEVAEGEFVSLLGPSGCGKTTTLRCVAGFELPSAGAIRFDGQDVTTLPPERRDIGMVFQNYALFPHMTVRENLAFGLEMRKVAAAEMARRIDEVLSMVQLTSLDARYPRQLSGGQQQRVALARALVIHPKLLLLDEPLANLDAKLRDEMRFFIRDLQKRIGITTIYVTHDQAEAMVMSDRIVVMFDGLIHQIGTAEDVYDRPATRAVASFIGLSNFLTGTVAGRAGQRWRLETGLGTVLCSAGFEPAAVMRASAMIRPEAIALADAPTGGTTFPGTVRERYFLGNLADYRVAMADGSMLQVQQPATTRFPVGQRVHVGLPADRAWLVRDGAR